MAPEPSLTSEEMSLALIRIAAWQREPDAALSCPRCGWEGLFVIDRSQRPESDVYVLSCSGCGLDASLEVPAADP